MNRYLLHHRHTPHECGVAFTAFKGCESPLRHHTALASCVDGDHQVWWVVDAASEEEALALLPRFVAQRTTPSRVKEVTIP